MTVHPQVAAEAALSEPVARFAEQHNSRHRAPKVGDTWVRIRPPDLGDIEQLAGFPEMLKFYAVGAAVKVTEVGSLVEVQYGGDRLLFRKSEFLRSFIRQIEGREWGQTGV